MTMKLKLYRLSLKKYKNHRDENVMLVIIRQNYIKTFFFQRADQFA